MEITLDDYLMNHGILHIKRIKNDVVIHTNLANREKRFAIKIKENQTGKTQAY
jgi:hypothetical protein